MRRLRWFRIVGRSATALLVALGLVLPGWGSTAQAADGIVVVQGTAFPGSNTYLAHFGCDSLFHVEPSRPAVEVVIDEAAPLGRRALSLRDADPGAATGPVSRVDSVATTRQGLSVRAPEGSTGVAWIWYATASLAAGEVWVGRADLTAPPGGWREVEPGDASYAWTRVDAASGAVLEDAGEGTAPEFTARHGDGPGYLLSGLGCDGNRQVLDDVRVGVPGSVTTYDLEGTEVTTSITVSRTEVPEHGSVTITGTTLDSQGVVGAALVLQARRAGETEFRDVSDPLAPGADGVVSVEVSPKVDTDYRWWFAERPYADAHASPESTVRVLEAAPSVEPSSPPRPADPPSAPPAPSAPEPTGSPSSGPAPASPPPTGAGSTPDGPVPDSSEEPESPESPEPPAPDTPVASTTEPPSTP